MAIKNTVVGLGLLMLPMMGLAAEVDDSANAAQSTPQKTMPKDAWLEQVKAIVSEPICKGFLEDPAISQRFKELNVTYESCLKQIPSITDDCIKQYYDKLPAQMTQEAASTWGRSIGECIGNRFATQYLYNTPDSDSSKQQDKKDQ